MLKDYLDRAAMLAAQKAVVGYIPSIQQAANNSSTVSGSIVNVNTDGSLKISTDTGVIVDNVKLTSDTPVGVGTKGYLFGSASFWV